MDIIVAVDENWGIGKDGDLLCPISKDLKRFREMTTGNVLVLGRKTLESFPKGNPLPNREHVVLTKNKDYAITSEHVVLCHELQNLATIINTFAPKTVFVIGGGSIYQQLLPLCENAYITKIHGSFPADTYFPNLDTMIDWEVVDTGEIQEEKGISFSFIHYKKK